jgi:hypothetical protein
VSGALYLERIVGRRSNPADCCRVHGRGEPVALGQLIARAFDPRPALRARDRIVGRGGKTGANGSSRPTAAIQPTGAINAEAAVRT